jgi:hypothetical protein
VNKPRNQPPPSTSVPVPAPAPAPVPVPVPAVAPDTALSLEDSGAYASRVPADKASPAGSAPPAVIGGFNPYDVSPHDLAATARAAQAKPRPRPKDLRKLSEWIRLRRQLETAGKDDPESD